MESANTAGGSLSELPYERPKTAREEAAAAERSKRDAEIAELRRIRAEQMSTAKSVQLTAAEAARKKREEELDEMRRLKADENEVNRKRLSQKGGALTTDMDAWRSNQWGAKEAERKNKLEAQSNLHGHRGYDKKKTAAELDRAAMSQAQRDQVAAMASLNLGEDEATLVADCEGEDPRRPPRGVMFKNALDEDIPMTDTSRQLRVSFRAGAAPESEIADAVAVKDVGAAKEEAFKAEATGWEASEGGLAKGEASEKETSSSPPSPEESADEPTEKSVKTLSSSIYKIKAHTYSRVDIKFSFGLIVRSSAADGFETENLRDNETLKKCMDGTAKILREQMPSRPKTKSEVEMEGSRSSFPALNDTFPEAYYDHMLEPTVISIEEDRKGEQEGKRTAKGNKRTLVKASFPVFLRNEAVDEEGKKRTARMLKETKTTVFKALRAAVSGGSFLR